jgi:hypothetical protein
MSRPLPIFAGPRLKTNPAITMAIFSRPDSPYLQIRLSGQTIGVVRRSARTREASTASKFGQLLMREIQRHKPQPVTRATEQLSLPKT